MVDKLQADLKDIQTFYDERLIEKGESIESLGWRDAETQRLRFDVLLRDFDLDSKCVLDIGCGFGDLFGHFKQKAIQPKMYIGIDISKGMIDIAKKRYQSENVLFRQGDFLNCQFETDIDLIFASGVFSLKVNDNKRYLEKVVEKAVSKAKIGGSFNFLSTFSDFQLDKNYHYEPTDVFNLIKNHFQYVTLYHDYPLYEFTTSFKKGYK